MSMTATYSPEDNKLRLYSLTRLPKELYERVRKAGFIWAPKQDLFVAPAWSPSREDLLLELCGDIGDEDTSLADRAEQRAERFEGYRDNRTQDAERAHAAVHAIADNIPLGQPILVGHHSEKHARRDAEKIENGMRKAVNMWRTAEYWKDRAHGALAHAKYKQLPTVRARRIKTIEAEIRQCRSRFTPASKQVVMQERWNAPAGSEKIPHVWCAPRGGRGGSWVPAEDLEKRKAYYTRWIEHCERRLEYERTMLGEQGASHLLEPKAKPTQLPLCNYRAPEGLDIENMYRRGEIIHYPQVEMSRADYARICNDYKGTRVVGNSHRVRTAMRNHSLACVFITDATVHQPPAPVAPKPVEEPRRWPIALTAPAPDPQAEKFEAMRDQLKAGVKVVATPQLFPTPPELADLMVELAALAPGMTVLEPSAGTGNIIAAIRKHIDIHVTAVEINPTLAKYLKADTVRCADFLEVEDLGKFDRVVMNPPFANATDIDHILRALGMLKPGGRLVAICANGPRQNAQLQSIVIACRGTWEVLPADTFKSQGTGVSTVLITMFAPDEDEEEQEPEECRADTVHNDRFKQCTFWGTA